MGHTLNIQTLTKTDEQKNKKVLSKFMILGRIYSHPGPHAAHGLRVGHSSSVQFQNLDGVIFTTFSWPNQVTIIVQIQRLAPPNNGGAEKSDSKGYGQG